ncbi:MAG: Dabb family protein [Muribaculaceae bacterium]|nr:Dabb family protein [Muribaculaceae bacterium]
MIHHVVMFRFDGDVAAREAAAREFADALKKLPGIIPQLHSLEVGMNINPVEEYDMVLTACADTMTDVAEYSAHPAHLAAVALVKNRIKARACVDFEV